MLDTRIKTSVVDGIAFLPEVISHWEDPAYFADALNTLITLLVSQRRWSSLADLFVLLPVDSVPRVRSRIAFICALAAELNLLQPSDDFKAALGIKDKEGQATSSRVADALLELAVVSGERGYYSVMASLALGRDYTFFEESIAADVEALVSDGSSLPSAPLPQPTSLAPSPLDELEEYILRFLSFHLEDYAYREAVVHSAVLSASALLKIADALTEKKDYIKALRIMDILIRRSDFILSEDTAKIMYPRAFASVIEEAADGEGIPAFVLYAMIRTESYFSPEISSHAGAVGLSQLMPATAKEVAEQMGIKEPDLLDPLQNVSIGAKYFAEMTSRFGGLLFGLFAYNAGPGRMNRWSSQYGDLPDELFLEALPFTETRNHGKSVLVSAVAYAVLYDNMTSKAAVEHIFPQR